MYNFRILNNYIFCDFPNSTSVGEGLAKNVEIHLDKHTLPAKLRCVNLNNWAINLIVDFSEVTVEGVAITLEEFIEWKTIQTGKASTGGGGETTYSKSETDALLEQNKNNELKEYSAQFFLEGNPIVSIQHFGTFEQRSRNLLDFLTNGNKTQAQDDYNGNPVWNIVNNANGNFFIFPNFGDKRMNIKIEVSIICQNPPFDKGAVVHLKRGLNGTIVDDRSKSTIFQNFSTINPGQINFSLYSFGQGASDPFYQIPLGGVGTQLENVTSSNSYQIIKMKFDCVATVQQN